MDLVALAGSLINGSKDQTPICNSKEHKEMGLEDECINPVCHSEAHQTLGLETECIKPVCDSEDHKIVGLDKKCLPICDSEKHKTKGIDTDCRKVVNPKTFVLGRSLAKAWMYDGKRWIDIKPLSSAREQLTCSLVQTDKGVSKVILLIKYPSE